MIDIDAAINTIIAGINKKAEIFDSFKIEQDGVTYKIGFYTSGNGDFTQISRISTYDETQYHWAKSTNVEQTVYNIVLGTKIVSKFAANTDEMQMRDYENLVNVLLSLDNEKKLKPRILNN